MPAQPIAMVDDEKRNAEILAAMVGDAEPGSGPVLLADPDDRWPEVFRKEEERVRRALSADRIVAVHHVGSTSVPDLPSKPIIDMLLVVPDSSDEAAYVPPMEDAGYTLRIREPDWHEHRLLVGPPQAPRINLHVFSADSPEVERMLRFRDRLRTNDDDRRQYADVKRELASQEWRYVQHYADAKSKIVEEILARSIR
jgi:GrpB-like predicted nucleotidyltransferase (UPF0157 family)